MVGGVNCSQVCFDLLESEEKLKLKRIFPTGSTIDQVVPVWIHRSHHGATGPYFTLVNLMNLYHWFHCGRPGVGMDPLVPV